MIIFGRFWSKRSFLGVFGGGPGEGPGEKV